MGHRSILTNIGAGFIARGGLKENPGEAGAFRFVSFGASNKGKALLAKTTMSAKPPTSAKKSSAETVQRSRSLAEISSGFAM